MPKKLIAFDFDGTMVNTERLTLPRFVAFVEEQYGAKIGVKTWRERYDGRSGQSLIDELNAAYGKKVVWGEFIAQHNAMLPTIFREVFADGLPLAPGLPDVLKELWERKALFCVCTNSQKPRNELAFGMLKLPVETMRDYLLWHCFSGVEEGRKSKPAPDVYADAAKYFKVSPSNAIAIEDSAAGVTAAKAAGYAVVVGYVGLADHPREMEKKLKLVGATHILPHWDDFLTLLDTL